ncbi:hypothetical protein ES708_17213 [subsurface metagenome]
MKKNYVKIMGKKYFYENPHKDAYQFGLGSVNTCPKCGEATLLLYKTVFYDKYEGEDNCRATTIIGGTISINPHASYSAKYGSCFFYYHCPVCDKVSIIEVGERKQGSYICWAEDKDNKEQKELDKA